ncbi:hypothetical protein [Aestuariimicrobium ganziense]|uniref:hypothetical protein n=1 Tax=Aestuariimicrobium ganziense TaxID=2773677 RepID=UPI001944669D|nr:hypothetical protein [Aestuariimicrobium ganziense]
MAEIRKFTPAAGGTIAQALAKAMGETVRPVTPGAPPKPGPEDEPIDERESPLTQVSVNSQFLVAPKPKTD